MKIFSNRLTNKPWITIATALLATGLSWSSVTYAAPEKLVLTGSSTVAPLAGELARRYVIMGSKNAVIRAI